MCIYFDVEEKFLLLFDFFLQMVCRQKYDKGPIMRTTSLTVGTARGNQQSVAGAGREPFPLAAQWVPPGVGRSAVGEENEPQLSTVGVERSAAKRGQPSPSRAAKDVLFLAVGEEKETPLLIVWETKETYSRLAS
jgi:hypothetical protein